MTISQSRPPPLPMCSFPHGVASPAQSRPALRMPPAVPRPPRRTTSSPASQIHPGVNVHRSREAGQRRGGYDWNLSSTARPALPVLTWPPFCFGRETPIVGLATARAAEAILCSISYDLTQTPNSDFKDYWLVTS